MIHKCGIVLFLSLMATAGAFFLPSATPHGTRMSAGREQDSSTSLERRDLLQNSVGQVLGLSALMLGRANLMGTPQQAQAAVGEEAFQRVLRGQREWAKVGKTIADREGKLADAEWVNTQIFLRNSYMVGEDMRRVVRDSDGEKRDKGTAIAKEFQRLTLDMDKPAKGKDFQGFIEAQKKGAAYFEEFLALLSDVPDEL
ncbi:Hypothetical protein NocV09_00203660 [Nannochloropsis oceanica]